MRMMMMVTRKCSCKSLFLVLFGFVLATVVWFFNYYPLSPNSAQVFPQLRRGLEPPQLLHIAENNSSCYYRNPALNRVLVFLELCREAGLEPLLVDGALLREVEAGSTDPCFWQIKATTGSVFTFAVIDPTDKALARLSEAFNTKMPFNQGFSDPDPRNVTSRSFLHNQLPPSIPTHFLWWSRAQDDAGHVLVHAVVFRTRGRYLWHSQLLSPAKNNSSLLGRLPFPLSRISLSQHGALIDRFSTQKRTIEEASVTVPGNISSFLQSLEEYVLLECNHEMARKMIATFPQNKSIAPKPIRDKMSQALEIAVRTLDSLRVKFWISSGTFLGWYRQCDFIPYTNDVDFEIKIEDYNPEIPKAMQANGLRFIRQLGKLYDSWELTFKRGLTVDLFFMYEETNHTWFGMFDPSSFKKYRLIFPKFTQRWTEFGGLRVRVPYPPEAYLDAHYGANTWETPKSNYHWLGSPPNRKFAGVWKPEEKAGLVRHF